MVAFFAPLAAPPLMFKSLMLSKHSGPMLGSRLIAVTTSCRDVPAGRLPRKVL